MAIIVSGTPGTGKTTAAKKLARILGYNYLDTAKLIKKYKAYDSYDYKRKCFVVDTRKLNKMLISKIKENEYLIIDSHLSHYLPKKYAKHCIITKCTDLKLLEKRLKRRGYSKSKIRENLDCEIFDVCLNEAKEKKHNITVIDTSKRFDIKKIVRKLK
jgi:adenylate kinase